MLSLLSHTIALSCNSAKTEHLSAAVEELEEGAAALNLKVLCVGVNTLCNCILMQITLYALNHLNLSASLIKSDSVRVACSEENLEHLEGVAIECISRDLSLAIYYIKLRLVSYKHFSSKYLLR